MNAVIKATEANVESSEQQLLLDLETLSDVELAQIGGGQGIFVLD
jgi:hypothetical protein